MALRRESRKAGLIAIKKAKRAKATSGPCVDHGEHINIEGRRAASKGKKAVWDNVGALTSCEVCEESPRGPKLHRVVWRYHKKF